MSLFLSFEDLRSHQQTDTDTLRNVIRSILPESIKRILFEASVGYGKSFVIQFLAGAYSKAGKIVWVLSNRSAVIEQLKKRAGSMPGVEVMTVQAADARRSKISKRPADLILIDEVHMGGSAAQYARVMDCAPDALVVAFTGSPRPETFDTFPDHVKGRSARWLTDNGFLAPLRYVCPDPIDLSKVKLARGEYDPESVIEALEKNKIYSNAINAYRKYAASKPCLAFCVNVKHAQDTADEFEKAGIPCQVMTGKDKKKEVKEKIAFLKKGGLLFTVDKVSAGFDLPELPVILVLRPTKSEQLWVQILGRVARALEGKTYGLVLDLVGNTLRLGTLTEERDWKNLDKKRTAQNTTEDGESLSVRQCPSCMFIFESGPKECPCCGETLAKERRISKAESVRLKELDEADQKRLEEERKKVRKSAGGSYKQKKAFCVHKRKMSWPQAHEEAIRQLQNKLDEALRFQDPDLESFVRAELERHG